MTKYKTLRLTHQEMRVLYYHFGVNLDYGSRGTFAASTDNDINYDEYDTLGEPVDNGTNPDVAVAENIIKKLEKHLIKN